MTENPNILLRSKNMTQNKLKYNLLRFISTSHQYILSISFTIFLHRYLYRYDRHVKAHSNTSVSCVSSIDVMMVKKSEKWG